MILIANLPIDVHYHFSRLLQYMKQRRLPYVVVSTLQELDQLKAKISHIVLPGSEAYVSELEKHPRLLELLQGLSKLPVSIPRIGICFGAQYLYTVAGGHLQRLDRGICSKRKLQHSVFPISYGSFCLHEILKEPPPPSIEYIAWACLHKKQRPCAFKFTDRTWYGLLFHPEMQKDTWMVLDTLLGVV